jgi:hypothetical protein
VFLWKPVKRAKKKIAAAVYEYPADCGGEWDTMISRQIICPKSCYFRFEVSIPLPAY